MKRTLQLILTTLIVCTTTFSALAVDVSQMWTWTGNAGDGLWKTGANWSASPIDPNQTYPHNYNDALNSKNFIANVFINSSTTISFTGDEFLNSLSINSASVNLVASGGTRVLTISFAESGAGMNVGGGATLQLGSGSSSRMDLNIDASGSSSLISGAINGTLDIAGSSSSSTSCRLNWNSDFSSPFSTLTVGSGGKVLVSGGAATINGGTATKLFFNSGATYEIQRDGGTIPGASYDVGSKILVTEVGGARVTNPSLTTNSFSGDNTVVYNGDIEFNNSAGATGQGGSPNQWSLNSFTMPSMGNLTMKKGYLRLLGSGLTLTPFTIASIDFPNVGGNATFDLQPSTASATNIVVTGNLSMAGTGKLFTVNSNGSNTVSLTINGNITQSGGTIDLASSSAFGKITLLGNINQTGGTLTESGTSTTSGLIFGGSTAQNATLSGTVSGNNLIVTINNNNNHVNLLSNVTLPYRLQCSTADIILGNNNLTVTEKALGSRSGGSVVTNGIGSLILKNVDNVGKDFPVGYSNLSHDAVYVTNTTGTADFSVRVSNTINPSGNTNLATTLPRQWTISSVSTDAQVEFDPDPSAGPQNNPKSVAQLVSGAWVAAAASLGANNGYPYAKATSYTSFTSFIVGTSSAIPVELTSFTAQAKDKSNLVRWSTATERNVGYFDIERSANGLTQWQIVHTLKANGDALTPKTYQFADETPLSISYYRLNTVDLDGKTAVSKVVSVNRVSQTVKINRLSPMPFSEDALTIGFESSASVGTVHVTDIIGRVVYSEKRTFTEGQNTLILPLSKIASGTYFLMISDGRSNVVEKIIKQ